MECVMKSSVKAREQRLRRKARAQGYDLVKSGNCYSLMETRTNARLYHLTDVSLETAEWFFDDAPATS
jgi:hypothetical protein